MRKDEVKSTNCAVQYKELEYFDVPQQFEKGTPASLSKILGIVMLIFASLIVASMLIFPVIDLGIIKITTIDDIKEIISIINGNIVLSTESYLYLYSAITYLLLGIFVMFSCFFGIKCLLNKYQTQKILLRFMKLMVASLVISAIMYNATISLTGLDFLNALKITKTNYAIVTLITLLQFVVCMVVYFAKIFIGQTSKPTCNIFYKKQLKDKIFYILALCFGLVAIWYVITSPTFLVGIGFEKILESYKPTFEFSKMIDFLLNYRWKIYAADFTEVVWCLFFYLERYVIMTLIFGLLIHMLIIFFQIFKKSSALNLSVTSIFLSISGICALYLIPMILQVQFDIQSLIKEFSFANVVACIIKPIKENIFLISSIIVMGLTNIVFQICFMREHAEIKLLYK